MIKTRKELKFYIAADNMINRGYFSPPITSRIKHLFSPDITMDFLKCMRFLSYYSNKKGLLNKFFTLYYKRLYIRLSLKCGFTIGYNCFGYALLIHHYGTIVCGASNRIGNFASLNTSTCIIENGSIIGDFFYMGTGSVISKKVSLGDNVKVGANSVVNQSYSDNIILAGTPANIKRNDNRTWLELYDNDINNKWRFRYNSIIELKNKMNL